MKKLLIVCVISGLMLTGLKAFAREGLFAGIGFGYNDITSQTTSDYKDDVSDVIQTCTNDKFTDMVPLTVSGHLQYNVLRYLFVRTGFNYTFATEGKFTFTLGGSDYENMYNFSSWEIPLTVGISIDVADSRGSIYLGLGMSYGSATFNYTYGLDSHNYHFKNSGFGPHFLAGANYFVTESLGLFCEFQMTSNHDLIINGIGAGYKKGYNINAGGMFYRFGVVYKVL
ncbi:MAG: hypothetical protein CVV44_08680 [Spirochaetae bacterium HGW-Spirochaetae-1]|jgi:hypothetical protein|nr:MAG: hypothetical protein CVV44_08680 [Spirochaetae bacterium HGW-Spirochaetae-1]